MTDFLTAYNDAQESLRTLAAVAKAAKNPACYASATMAEAELAEAFAFDMEGVE